MTDEQSPERAEHALLPVIEELSSLGFAVDDLGALPKDKDAVSLYGEILAEWLRAINEPDAKLWIVHALSSRFVDPAVIDVLVDEFEPAGRFPSRDPDLPSDLQWAIGSALEAQWRSVPVDQLTRLLRLPAGRSLEMVAMALGKAARRRDVAADAAPALREVLRDPVVGGHAVDGLGSGRLWLSPEAASELRPLVASYEKDERAWVRRSAARALRRIDACQ